MNKPQPDDLMEKYRVGLLDGEKVLFETSGKTVNLNKQEHILFFKVKIKNIRNFIELAGIGIVFFVVYCIYKSIIGSNHIDFDLVFKLAFLLSSLLSSCLIFLTRKITAEMSSDKVNYLLTNKRLVIASVSTIILSLDNMRYVSMKKELKNKICIKLFPKDKSLPVTTICDCDGASELYDRLVHIIN